MQRTIKKSVHLLRTEQLSSFWLTFRLRLIVSRTDESIRQVIRNSQVIYDGSSYCEKLNLLKTLEHCSDQIMSYNKDKLNYNQNMNEE